MGEGDIAISGSACTPAYKRRTLCIVPTSKTPRVDSVVVNIRMTAAERDTLDALAEQVGRSRSSMVRRLITLQAAATNAIRTHQ